MNENDNASLLRSEIARILREDAEVLAETILAGMQRSLGGRSIYMPAPDPAWRAVQIRAEFNGRNLSEVMRKFGVSRATVYRALK